MNPDESTVNETAPNELNTPSVPLVAPVVESAPAISIDPITPVAIPNPIQQTVLAAEPTPESIESPESHFASPITENQVPQSSQVQAIPVSPVNVQSSAVIVPEGIGGWNWGAFFLNWIWAIGNKSWIGLLALVPGLGLIMGIILGLKGSEWAWQHRKFESVDQFKAVQKAWAKWGLIIFIISLILLIAGIVVMIMFPSTPAVDTSITPIDLIN